MEVYSPCFIAALSGLSPKREPEHKDKICSALHPYWRDCSLRHKPVLVALLSNALLGLGEWYPIMSQIL